MIIPLAVAVARVRERAELGGHDVALDKMTARYERLWDLIVAAIGSATMQPSRNRLNVAVSRAKALSVLVASPQLLAVECKTVEQMKLANVLAQRGHPHVVRVFELGYGSLRHIEPTRKLGLADGLAMADLVEPDLLKSLCSRGGDSLARARFGEEFVFEHRELGSGHQITPSARSSVR
ncbi:MAG: hypothetical protein H0U92_05725 [Actinobacteria bacterium]|nr:hypothetical protein [Actinomycetota bacterium]